MTKILFVIKALAAGPGGGAERIFAAVSSALSHRGHDIEVLTFDAEGTTDFYPVAHEVRRVRLGIGGTMKRSGPLVTLRRVLRIRRIARSFRPNVAIGFMHSAYVPLALALLGTGIPVIGSERTSFSHYRERWVEWLLIRLSLPFLRSLTVNNRGVRNEFPTAVARRMIVIPNPVARADDPGVPRRGAKVVLSVGGLRPEKDHSTLVSAFAQIAQVHPDWRVRIVGDGPLRGALEQQAKMLGVSDRVDFVGPVADVASQYRRAQFFALPSRYEAFPNCLAEALAHGLPAIGFRDCAGTNELIVDGVNGWLVDGPSRVDALADGLSKMMSDQRTRERLSKASPRSIERYSLKSITDQWERLIDGVVSSGGHRL
jgi:glycosyltransferase involved in cell wall biosynthesis